MAKEYEYRKFYVLAAIILGCLILLARSLYLQIFDNTYKRKGSVAAIEKEIRIPARGLIFDRNDSLLVKNETIYDIEVVYDKMDADMDTLLFCKLLKIDTADFRKAMQLNWKDYRISKFEPVVVFKQLPYEQVARLKEYLFQFPGFQISQRYIRRYQVHHCAHVLGYLGEVNEQQIKDSKGVYRSGDFIGIAGIEASHEQDCRGVPGIYYKLKDNRGRVIGAFQDGALDIPPVPGKDLKLSIDFELQAYCEDLMVNKTGSIVAIEPATGEILAFVSSPSYDPALLEIGPDRNKHFGPLVQHPLKPFYNRAATARYPPGSTFKTIVSLIGMQDTAITPYTYFHCPGAYYYVTPWKTYTFRCHGHGAPSGVANALRYSCNTYYFTLFRALIDKYGYTKPQIGLNNFNKYLNSFGLGHALQIDFPQEAGGKLPTPEYYDKLYSNKKWRSPTIMSLGIGQGEMQLTSIQMANLAAIIANKGWYYTPHFVKAFRMDTTPIPAMYRTRNHTLVDSKWFDPVIQGMSLVVQAGTARSANFYGFEICGKTGTSQNPHGEDHSVFIGFAPRQSPKIAVSVYVENAGRGGEVAAPIASLIMEKYINKTVTRTGLENNIKEMRILPPVHHQ